MQRVPKHINEAFSWPLQEVQWRLIISSSSSVDELVWAGACHDRPKTETSHPLPGFFDHQRLRAVVRHVEPDALVFADLRNLQTNFRVMLQFNADSQISIDDHITKSFDFHRCFNVHLLNEELPEVQQDNLGHRLFEKQEPPCLMGDSNQENQLFKWAT